jgi:hypothetical protein
MAITNIATPVAGAGQTVAYTGTHGVITNALPADCRCVRVVCTTAAFIEIGPSPTAVANTGTFVAANVPEYFQCGPNAKVSAVQVASGGSLYVVPCF